jgi:hypothetical protein
MHDTKADGTDIFVCDFCAQPWREDRPMVEGHRGSLICANCLSIAYTELVHLGASSAVGADETCVLCLETGRADPHWRSPAREESVACRRCIKQSAGVLHKDKDTPWTKPLDPTAAS